MKFVYINHEVLFQCKKRSWCDSACKLNTLTSSSTNTTFVSMSFLILVLMDSQIWVVRTSSKSLFNWVVSASLLTGLLVRLTLCVVMTFCCLCEISAGMNQCVFLGFYIKKGFDFVIIFHIFLLGLMLETLQ